MAKGQYPDPSLFEEWKNWANEMVRTLRFETEDTNLQQEVVDTEYIVPEFTFAGRKVYRKTLTPFVGANGSLAVPVQLNTAHNITGLNRTAGNFIHIYGDLNFFGATVRQLGAPVLGGANITADSVWLTATNLAWKVNYNATTTKLMPTILYQKT